MLTGARRSTSRFWNGGAGDGLPGFDHIIQVECKNWLFPVGSLEVAWFDTKLRLRGRRQGVLLSLSGVTGNTHPLRSAEDIISNAFREHRDILVVELDDLRMLNNAGDLVTLLKRNGVQLSVTRGLTI